MTLPPYLQFLCSIQLADKRCFLIGHLICVSGNIGQCWNAIHKHEIFILFRFMGKISHNFIQDFRYLALLQFVKYKKKFWWLLSCIHLVFRKPQKIDPNILMSVKTVRNVGYAPNPGTHRRNQVPYKLDNKSKHHPSVPDSPLGRGEYWN